MSSTSSQNNYDTSDEENFDDDSESLPSCQSEEFQSSSLELWEKTNQPNSVSFRLTWIQCLEHEHFKKWIQSVVPGGVVAPEKGRAGKPHYQCFLIGTTKSAFEELFRAYRVERKWYDKPAGEEGRRLLGGNKVLSIAPCKDLRKLAPYCIKENQQTMSTVTIWGIPQSIIELYEKITYNKHSTEEITKRMVSIDQQFALSAINDNEYLNSYMNLWIEYNKNFNVKWLISHYQLLKSKKDEGFKRDLVKQILSLARG